MHISRSIQIDAPVEKVFESISNFKEWPKWSPWLNAEPGCTVIYALDGKSYSWDGKYVGSGEMEVEKVRENKAIYYNLMFFRPWKSKAKVVMKLKPENGGTHLTWKMNSSVPFFLFFLKNMMEGFIGMDYERGLSMLKDLLETGEVPVQLDFGDTECGPFSIVGRRTECAIKDMPSKMTSDIDKLKEWLENSEVEDASGMMTIYHKWDVVNQEVHYTTGIPVGRIPDDLPDGFVSEEIPEIEAFTSTLTGPYRHLGNAWAAGMIRARNGAFKQSRKVHPFEIYENDPRETEEKDLVTTVYFPKR